LYFRAVKHLTSVPSEIMPRNVEIKARVEDLEAVKQRILALQSNAAYDVCPDPTVMRQKDSFFNLPAGKCGKLKLRQMVGNK